MYIFCSCIANHSSVNYPELLKKKTGKIKKFFNPNHKIKFAKEKKIHNLDQPIRQKKNKNRSFHKWKRKINYNAWNPHTKIQLGKKIKNLRLLLEDFQKRHKTKK